MISSMDNLPIRVLVVDDDRAFATFLAETLTERGYVARASTEPGEALRLASELRVDVAILDLIMPGMGGIELAEKLQVASPDTQVVVLTGFGDLRSAMEGMRHGVVAYLEKTGINADQLQLAVNEAADRGKLKRENRRLVERLRDSNRLLQALNAVSAQLAAEPHRDRVVASLARSARELLGATNARVLLFGYKNPQTLVVEMAGGDGVDALEGARFEITEGIAASVATSGEPVRLTFARTHARYSQRSDHLDTPLPGFLAVPLRHGVVNGVLLVAGRAADFTADEEALVTAFGGQAAVAIDNAGHQENAVNFFTHMSDILVSFLESRDVFYGGHSRAVASLSDMVTRRLGLSDAERRDIHFAALLHDIGKVRLDAEVLSWETDKAAALPMLQQHPALGLEILRPIALWSGILPLIHAHHERWDGQGYPLGQAKEQIPLGARVIAVADAFDAMTRSTPHREGRAPEEAITELEACAGSQFDPRVVRMFVAEYRTRGHQIPPS
jgi:response regulator RpfG family c-di-GMP phosphodiesterase